MKKLLVLMLAIVIVSCTSKKESVAQKENIKEWQIYVSPKRYGVSYGSGAYEVYRCHYCNPEESADAVINREMKVTIDSILQLRSKKGSAKLISVLEKHLDSLGWEREVVNQAIVDFLSNGY